jgi:hypothetical protein
LENENGQKIQTELLVPSGAVDQELELHFSQLDLHDTIHGLKVLYIEKHGEEPSDEIVDQWHESLKNTSSGLTAPAPNA